MRISNAEWGSLISGWVRTIETEDGYLSFRRFTEEQTENIVGRGFGARPNASSGMFLEIQGDVKRIAFDYRMEIGSSRVFFSFSVLEDGKPKQCEVLEGKTYEGHFSYEPTGPCRLTIYLPNLHATYFKNMEIDGTYERVIRPRKLFIAGDSITMGYDARQSYRSYANRLTEAMFAEDLNQAIGGEFFEEENLEHMPAFKPDVVVINYGTNDWSKERNVPVKAEAYLKRLSERFPDSQNYVILPIWRATEGTVREATGWSINDVREMIRSIALRYGFTVIPGIDLVPHDPELFSDHSLHPNDAGFDYYADNLIRELRMRAPELFE